MNEHVASFIRKMSSGSATGKNAEIFRKYASPVEVIRTETSANGYQLEFYNHCRHRITLTRKGDVQKIRISH